MSSRKQISRHALKRNRSQVFRIVSASPSPQEIKETMSDSYLSQRPPKRARRSSNPEIFSFKKPKTSLFATPAGSPSQFQTPCPSTLSEEQKYKLPSSLPMHPDQFSPLPVSRASAVISRPTSGHKENVYRRLLKKSESLHSPFQSRSGSACSSPQKHTFVSSPSKQQPLKRTLSDTNYNPNIPQSTSTASSPTRLYSPLHVRRPSAPSPTRRGTWISDDNSPFDFDFHFAAASDSTGFSLPSAMNDIDFNRPPSSLSFYGGDFDDRTPLFDDEVKGPLMLKSAYTCPVGFGSAFGDDDFDDSEPNLMLTHDPFGVSSGVKSLPTRARSPWLSDSIIFSQKQDSACIHSSPSSYVGMSIENEDDDMVFAFDPTPSDFEMSGTESDDPVIRSSSSGESEGELKQMFDDLALAPKNRLLTSRTRSLDSDEPTAPSSSQPKSRRDRRGTIRASDFTLAPPRRTRSGTITANTLGTSTTKRTRSGTIVASTAGTASASSPVREEGKVDEAEELSGWCANGWTVAAPPSPVVTRPRPRPRRLSWKAGLHSPDGRSEGGAGAGLLPSPILERKGKGKAPRSLEDVVMEEDEDDL